ncbi:PP2C family protein-serine/threonine phosphatase [Deinococcus yavapaiensis]|uniref:Serine phosphatase RsbU (Regulator of sigma subunit) n=1 Tax=Deinococcus yavapaiensis KR-236 TaxID=694435 RepID=A0A318S689_9DEIO|nr:PP2C family protein-serine/threonine phosphatase [Deinococcus yavapaiensis]PYE49900.1 serine phosphatase RsbU (regulator of sigma subunit) [Deinococcus yavapaiensis KR-236]
MPENVLQSTMDALGDCFDQVVFLEQAVKRAVRTNDLAGLSDLVQEAQSVMGARGSGLNLAGRWLTPVPGWLRNQPRPTSRIFTLDEADAPQHLLGVPLPGGWVAFWDKPSVFTAGDARLAETLGELISATEDALRARAERVQTALAEHDRQTAARIWRRVVPETITPPRAYRVVSVLRPAREVGGDFLTATDDWIVIGDVSGKGVPAAMFTGMFVSNLPLAVERGDVGSALARSLHTYLEDAEMFATLAALCLHPDGRFEYLSMGHPPIYLRHPDGSVESFKVTAPPLGTFQLPTYPMREGRFTPGGLMCLYTDGLSEAERESSDGLELFGHERIADVLRDVETPEAARDAMTAALQEWRITDDFTMAFVQYRPEDA